jgi:ABC-2 type transport system permease protein
MFVRTLQFRAEIIVYSILDIIPFFVLFFLWSAVYSNQEVINTYSFSDIIQYYIIVIVLQRFTATHFEGWRSQEIRMGKIDYYLTRPFSYMSEVISKEVGGKIVALLFSLPILSIFYFLVMKFYNLPPIIFNLNNSLVFFGLILVAYSIQIMLALWIVLLTFWFEGSSGLEHFKWVLLALFSGSAIPFEFMPIWLQQIFTILPFKYINYIPIQVILGKMTLNEEIYLSIFSTLVAMFLISKFLWNKAKYKYASAGG